MPRQPIEDLPDFPAIRRIQAALWGGGEILGAAVMVGLGSVATLYSPQILL